MRYRERGVGNMAFIVVLVLLLIAASMAFMKNDEVQENINKAQAAKDALNAAVERETSYETLCRTLIAGYGLEQQIPLATGAIPTAETAKGAIKTLLTDSANAWQTDSTFKVNAPGYKVTPPGENRAFVVKITRLFRF